MSDLTADISSDGIQVTVQSDDTLISKNDSKPQKKKKLPKGYPTRT